MTNLKLLTDFITAFPNLFWQWERRSRIFLEHSVESAFQYNI